MDKFILYHLNILSEVERVILKLKEEEYTSKLQILSGSSIGQHIRHVVEFYICLFSESDYVNYDERERNLLIEESPSFCLEIIKGLKSKLEVLDLEKNIQFRQTLGSHEVVLPTNYARELIYLSEHSIHHFALIKIGINTLCSDLDFDESFGVAESTLKYRKYHSSEKCAS